LNSGRKFVDQAKSLGYSDKEINTYLTPRITQQLQAGHTAADINAYWGIGCGAAT
jgi:hypothetical protein